MNRGTSESQAGLVCGCRDTPRASFRVTGPCTPARPTTAGCIYTTQPRFTNISPCAVCCSWFIRVVLELPVIPLWALLPFWPLLLPHFLFLFEQTPESLWHRLDTSIPPQAVCPRPQSLYWQNPLTFVKGCEER